MGTLYADVSDNGGVTAFSADTATAALRIDPLVSITGGSGGKYTISTTGPVPWDLVVSGGASWGPDTDLPFTVTIPADYSSTTLDLSGLAGLGLSDTFTVELAALGTEAPMLSDYDYYTDPGADSISTPETATTNIVGPGGAVAELQNGDEIPVALYNNSGAPMYWSTVDGTAKANTDYQAGSGTIPAGGQETVDIELENLDASGPSGFFIVTTGGGYSGSSYYPVTIQPVGVQLLADSNNDGRIDAEGDATANAASLSSGTGGVVEFADGGDDGDPSNSRQALIASEMLVEVKLAFSRLAGTSITLSAPGDAGNLEVFATPDSTTQINVDGDGTTWASDSAPDAVWVAARAAGEETLLAQVIQNGNVTSSAQARVDSKDIWQAAASFVKSQALPPAGQNRTFLLQWNANNDTPVRVSDWTHYQDGTVYILPDAFEWLRRYATSDPNAPPARLLGGAIGSLTNEAFSAWFADLPGGSWIFQVTDSQPYSITLGRKQAEEAMSSVADYAAVARSVPTYSAIFAANSGYSDWIPFMKPGHGEESVLMRIAAGSNTPLNEEGYGTVLWIMYNGDKVPGNGTAGSRAAALSAFVSFMWPPPANGAGS